jgi:tRNA-dihydrouridine synthase
MVKPTRDPLGFGGALLEEARLVYSCINAVKFGVLEEQFYP